MDARQDFYLAALAQCPGLGSRRLGPLLQTGLDAVSLWQMPALEMSRLVKMPQGLVSTIDAFRRDHPDMPEALADICEQRGVHLCTLQDEDYPYLLKEIFSPPPVLYCRGTLMPKERRVAIVGSRRLSPYGEALALEFGEQLAAAGLTVVSGAARGIDTRSHRGALKTGRTVAVLGCGIDVAYPAEKRRLLAQIADSFEKDLLILPSSIHEVLIIPVDHISKSTLDHYATFIREVNETQLADDEILSDHAYYFQRATQMITY